MQGTSLNPKHVLMPNLGGGAKSQTYLNLNGKAIQVSGCLEYATNDATQCNVSGGGKCCLGVTQQKVVCSAATAVHRIYAHRFIVSLFRQAGTELSQRWRLCSANARMRKACRWAARLGISLRRPSWGQTVVVLPVSYTQSELSYD